MPLHHYIEQYFQNHPHARVKGVPISSNEKKPKVLKVEDTFIQSTTNQIPIRIYTPDEEDDYYPLFLFFPGGGFINGDIGSYDTSCRLLSSLSGYKIIVVNYRFSPDYPAPSAFQDCYFATQWIMKHAHDLGGRANDVVIGGPSAGGNLATMVVLKSIITGEFQLAKQVLQYPITDLDVQIKGSEYQSRELYNGKYGVDITKSHADFIHHKQSDIPSESPIFVDNQYLAKMPKTLIFTAEYDPLCDEGELYAEKLKRAGVQVRLVRFDGNIHGFMQSFPGSPDYMRGYDITAEFLNND